MSIEGFACLFFPTLAKWSGFTGNKQGNDLNTERIFPPKDGFTFLM